MDPTAGAEPEIRLGGAPGTVVVTVATEASPDEVWCALTEPARVEQWFGVLSGELEPAARVRLDFEDGDFFDLEVDEVARPVLRWRWRFMGCGPRDAIELRVDEDDHGGSLVGVTDHERKRGRDEALELGSGWQDFLSRLRRHVEIGVRTRYDWRSDVEVWSELPTDADSARRLVIGSAAEWLPLEDRARNLLEARALVLEDGEDPPRFAIDGVTGTGPASVQFETRPAGLTRWLSCSIAVAPRGDGSALMVHQSGFRDLDASEAEQRRIRKRFARAWLAAAKRARSLAAG